MDLLEKEFGAPDWTELYPVKTGKDDHLTPVGMLSPRMACKLFHDGVFIIQKAEEHAKYFQDRMPEISHRCYKKKQWYVKLMMHASLSTCIDVGSSMIIDVAICSNDDSYQCDSHPCFLLVLHVINRYQTLVSIISSSFLNSCLVDVLLSFLPIFIGENNSSRHLVVFAVAWYVVLDFIPIAWPKMPLFI